MIQGIPALRIKATELEENDYFRNSAGAILSDKDSNNILICNTGIKHIIFYNHVRMADDWSRDLVQTAAPNNCRFYLLHSSRASSPFGAHD